MNNSRGRLLTGRSVSFDVHRLHTRKMAQRHFEGKAHAKSYQCYRVSPPQELIDEVLNYLRKTIHGYLDLAVDVGCGSGQGTELLAPHFLTVVGTDISPAQLKIADADEHAPNVCYRESPAEDLPFEDESADLVTSMSAAHWFDHPRFLKEADRILKPGGCLAVLSYTMDFDLEYEDQSTKLNEICQEFYAALLPFRKAYIGSSSLQVYKKIYDMVSYKDKEWHECWRSRVRMPLSSFIGLVETFATYQNFLEKHPDEAQRLSKTITERLMEAMGASSTPDTEVVVVVKYFYFLASKPQES